MDDHYDVIVIGGGPAGEHCGRLAEAGLRVAIAERGWSAGVLVLGLHPLEDLLRPGEAIQAAREAGAREAVNGELDAEQAFAWRDFRSPTTTMPARSSGWRARGSTCCEARPGSTARAR